MEFVHRPESGIGELRKRPGMRLQLPGLFWLSVGVAACGSPTEPYFDGDTHLAICPGDYFLYVGWEERCLAVEGIGGSQEVRLEPGPDFPVFRVRRDASLDLAGLGFDEPPSDRGSVWAIRAEEAGQVKGSDLQFSCSPGTETDTAIVLWDTSFEFEDVEMTGFDGESAIAVEESEGLFVGLSRSDSVSTQAAALSFWKSTVSVAYAAFTSATGQGLAGAVAVLYSELTQSPRRLAPSRRIESSCCSLITP